MRNILWGALGVLLIGSAAAAMDITAPGVTVPKGQTGVVQADLTCPPNTVGISLEHRARLDLNGHTLDGCFIATHATERRDVKIKGPGTIRNAGIDLGAGKCSVTDVTIENAPTWSILGHSNAFEEPTTLTAKRVTCTGPALAHIRTANLRATDVTVSGALGDGIQAGTFRGSRVQATNNGDSGIISFGSTVRGSQITVTGNNCGGVFGFLVAIRGGVVTGNAVGDPTCADIYSTTPPKLSRVTCGTSSDTNLPSNTWGVCALD